METNGDKRSEPSNTRKARETQYIYWFFTLNNYKNGDPEILVHLLGVECDWFIFQEETGQEGTKHLQGTIKLKIKKRLSELKKLNPCIHWEKTKSVKASVEYCSKLETRSGKQWSKNIEIPEELDLEKPYGWQLEVMNIIKTKPDKRSIHWFWEPNGNIGKSTLCKYLVVKHNALILSGKASDMFHQISKFPNKRTLILFDIPRTSIGYINYAAIEQIKNGLIYSGKYEGAQLVFNCPHIIIFANEEPNTDSMSKDRWIIHKI